MRENVGSPALEERVERLEANQMYASYAYSRLVTYLCGRETTGEAEQVECVIAEIRAAMDAVLEDESLTAAQREYLVEYRDKMAEAFGNSGT